MAKSVKSEIRDWKRDRWERLSRNPDYISDYNNFKNSQRPVNSNELDDWFNNRIVLILNICEKYGLSYPIDPQKKFQDGFCRFIKLTDGYVHFPLGDDQFTIEFPISKGSFMCMDDNGKTECRAFTRDEALVDGKYLSVLLDIDLPDKIVQKIASNAVRTAKTTLGIKDDIFRMRLKENCIAYQVWDKRSAHEPFPKIAAELFPNEPLRRAAERARKSYMRACELITGRKYKPFTKREIRSVELRKTCGTCKDSDCYMRAMKDPKRWIPCPEVRAYIEQDYVALQEKLPKK